MSKKLTLTPEEIALNNYWEEQAAHMAGGGDNQFRDDLGTVMSLGGTSLLSGTNPQNTFQATAPSVATYDWQTGMEQANQQANQGYQQQGQLANALTEQAAGRGPSLANMQLNQATNQNLAQAAGQAASARGLNPAQAARMAGQNQANIQQQAAGQSAMTKLQEQRSAQNQLGNVLAQQRAGSQQMYGTNVGALGAQNQNITAGQLGAESINARTASENVAGQRGLIGGILGGLGGGMQYAEGGEADWDYKPAPMMTGYEPQFYQEPSYPTPLTYPAPGFTAKAPDLSAPPATSQSIPTAEEAAAKAAAPAEEDKKKGGKSNANFWLNMLMKIGMAQAMLPKGGPVIPKAYAEGGDADMEDPNAFTETQAAAPVVTTEDVSGGGEGGPGMSANQALDLGSNTSAPDETGKNLSALGSILALFNDGGQVPGKAEYAGNDPRNDVVPAVLSKKEIVIPRDIALSEDAPEKSAEFVAGLKHQNAEKGDPAAEYTSEIAQLDDRLARLEHMLHSGSGVAHMSSGGSPCRYCQEEQMDGRNPPFHPNCRCG